MRKLHQSVGRVIIKFHILFFFLSMFITVLPNNLPASENEMKNQRRYEALVEGCVCEWLELEAKNNTYLSYQRIVAGCNGLVAERFTPKNYKPSPSSPEFNNLEYSASASKWLQSKQR